MSFGKMSHPNAPTMVVDIYNAQPTLPSPTTTLLEMVINSTERPFTEGTNDTTNGTMHGGPCGSCSFPTFDLILNLCIIGALCLLGLAGNTLSILTLQKERSNRVAVLLLQALAVADNACLLISFAAVSIFMGLKPSLPNCGQALRASQFIVHCYVTPLAYMAQTATIWITVLLAANRFIAICKPFLAQRCLTLTRTQIQVAAVAAFSILFNLPRFFQTTLIYDSEGNVIGANATSIGQKSTFGKIYTNGLYSLLVLLLPFVLLLVLNVQLILELRASHQRMRRNSISPPPEAQDENITFIMIIIIIVFLVCHMPDRVLQIVLAITPPEACTRVIYYAQCFCNLLFIINSSINFLIYYVFRKRFRKILRTRVCGWIGNKSSEDVVSMDSGAERIQLHSPKHSRVHFENGNGLSHSEKNEKDSLTS